MSASVAVPYTTAVQALVVLALVVVLVAVVVDGVRALRTSPWSHRLVVTAIAVGAAAIRLAVPTGFGETNVRTASVFQGVIPTQWEYGVALPTLQHVLLLPVPHAGPTTLFQLALVFGVAAVVATIALARAAGAGLVTAWLAGALLALSPVAARFAHTDAPGVFESPIYLVGLIALLRHAERPTGRAWIVAGAGIGLAAVCRPEAVLLVPLAPLICLAAGRPIPWRASRTGGAIAIALLIVVPHVVGLLGFNPPQSLGRAGLGAMPAPLVHGWRHFAWWLPAFSSPVVAVASALGIVLAPPPWRRRLGWTLLALGTASFILEPMWSPAWLVPNTARHQVRSLPFFAVLAAQGTTAVAGRLGRLGVVVIALVVGASAWSCRDLGRATTAHAESAFFLEGLADVPDDCTLVTWLPDDDRGFTIAGDYLSQGVGRRHHWLYLRTGDEPLPQGCVVWYRTANCATRPPRGEPDTVCARFEATHTLRPLRETRVDAVPWSFEVYTEDPVRLGFYEVR